MSSPFRVTRVITWLPVGGIERRIVAVLPRLAEKGLEVRLVCIREYGPLAEELRAAGVPVDLVPFRSRLDPRGMRELSAYLRQHRSHVIHAHMYRSGVAGTIAGRMAGTPVIFTQVHNVDSWDSKRQVLLDRFLCRWRSGVLCVSKAVQEDVCQRLRIPAGKAPVLYNGVDTNAFQPDPQARRAVRQELGVDERTAVLLVPARLHGNKNPLATLRVFQLVIRERPRPALLVFAGDGPLRDEIESEIKQLGIGDRVRLLGSRDDMPALYNAADAVLLSTRKEGFSNAIVEALACGKPVLAADVGGNGEAITGITGWIHPRGDEEEFAKQLAEALNDLDALRARSEDCRVRAMRFSLDRLVEETFTLYQKAYDEYRIRKAGG